MSQGTGTVDYGRVVVRRRPRLVLSDGRELPIREPTRRRPARPRRRRLEGIVDARSTGYAAPMGVLEIGIRINMEKGLGFFGVEEVNRRIASGARVLEIRPAGAIMTKVGEDGEDVRLSLGGCQFQVVLEDG